VGILEHELRHPRDDHRERHGAAGRAGAALVILDDTRLNGNRPAIGHGGDTVGDHTLAYSFPEKKVTIAVIVDSDAGPTSGVPSAPTHLGDSYMTIVNPYFGTRR
jgi:hypothetical protein